MPALAAAVAAVGLLAVGLAGSAPAQVLYDLHAGESGVASTIAAAGGPPAVIAPPDTVVGEADGIVDLEIRLSEPATDPVLVSYGTVAVTANSTTSSNPNCSSDPDFVTVSGPLTFAQGEVSKIVQVQLIDCAGPEDLVSFRLELSNVSSNATIARATTLVSIVNNDIQASAPKLFVRDAVVDQQAGTARVPVLLGGPRGQSSTSTVTVQYATADGTATAGDDYTATSGTLTFDPGETVETIVVPVNAAASPRASRMFSVTLTNPTGNATVADATGTVTIGSSAVAALTTPDLAAAPDVVVGEADGYVDLPVRLSAPGVNPVTVTYATSNSTASAGSSCNADYVSTGTGTRTITFLPGETTKVVRVQLLDCDEVEGLVSFLLTISNPSNATIARASTLVSIVNDSTQALNPRLFARDAVVDEKDGTVRVPVLLGGPAGQTSSSVVTVHYATADRTATAGVDYRSVSGTLSFAAGQTVKTVVVPIIDTGPKPPKNFVLDLSSPTGGASIADGTGTIVIGASPVAMVPEPGISAPPDLVVGEADGYVDLPVRLSAPGQSPLSVNWSTSAGAAGSGTSCTSDFVSTTGTLSFAPGETTKVVRVQLLDCTDVEGLVSFKFTLSGQSNNATLLRATTLVSIVDDSTSGSNPRVFARDAVVDQKDGNVLVPILLGGPAGQVTSSVVTLHYQTADGTALANVDYGPVSGTVSFAPGQTAKTIVVPIFDTGPKPTKRFTLNLSNVSPSGSISDGIATVTIGASSAVAVPQPVISAGPDVIVGEADGYVDLPVRLSAPGTGPVTVTYAASGVTASAGSSCSADYVSPGTGSLIFVPGETTKVVRVQLLDCADVESLISFKLTLSNAANATIGRTSTLVSIVNATRVAAIPRLYVRDATVDQKDGAVLVPVLLGGAAGQASDTPVTVSYSTADGNASAGVDYAAAGGTLSFAPGQTVKNIVVPITDAGAKDPRSFAVTLSAATNASIGDATGVVTIGSSSAPAVAMPAASAATDIAVSESDGYVDLPVTLAAPGTAAASVNYSTTGVTAHPGTSCSSSADFVTTSGTLNFAAGETTKVVRVQLLDCSTVPGTVTFKLNLTSPVNATVPRASVTVSIVDEAGAWTPNNTVLPTLSGTPRGGQTLTADPGSWVGAPTSFQYAWLRCNAAGALCGTVDGATGPTYALGPVDGGSTMRVEVFATNLLGTSLPAYSAPTALVLSAPSVPLNVSAAAGDGSATITFSPPAFNGGAPISSYDVAVSPGGTTVSNVTSPATINGLANGTTYTFSLTATSSEGTSPPVVVTATPRRVPDAPTGVVGVPGNGQVVVSFVTPASDGGAPITSYTVTSSPDGVTAAGTASPITVIGLTNGTSYTFTVTATNAVGPSPASSASAAVTPATLPGAPTGIGATAGNGQATVTFTPPASNGGAAITSYTVTSSPGGFTATGGASPLTVTGLTNGTGYTFTVKATNSVGIGPASAASTSVTPMTVPVAPTGVTAAPGNARATVSFAAPSSNGGGAITSYTVTSSPGGFTASGAASPLTVTGLTNGTSYTFTVTATNGAGPSPASAPSNAVTPTGPPGMPTGVAATTVNTLAVVTFTPPAVDGGAAITSYTVTVSPGGRTVTGSGSPIVIAGLTSGTAYTFTVTANNSAGPGSASAPSNSVTPLGTRSTDTPDPPTAEPRPVVPNPPSTTARPPQPTL